MQTATLSDTFELAIPKTICDDLGLQAGQRFTVLTKGEVIELVPLRSIAEARGLFKGADPTGYRDREDRL
jgi:AbrB family looped-hinge helix DNA binding protein